MSIEKHVLYKRFVLFCNFDLLSNQKCVCGYKCRNEMVSRCCELSMEVGTQEKYMQVGIRYNYLYLVTEKETPHGKVEYYFKIVFVLFRITFIIESFKNYTETKIINSSVLHGYTRGIIKLAKASKMFVILYINFDGVSP